MDIKNFVEKARAKGLEDREIKNRLLDAGWPGHEIYAALEKDQDLVPPAAPVSSVQPGGPVLSGHQTINVVNSGFSASGFEYLIYFVSVGIVALSFGAIGHNLVSTIFTESKYSWYGDIIPVAVSALLVALPIMIFLMLRLKKKEQQDTSLLLDPSRRRAVQLLMLVTFIVGVIKLIAYLYNIIAPSTSYSGEETSLVAETFHALITIGIAGGLFVNYWLKQAKNKAE